ncbi:MAG: SpoIID/LytB domain-containing protein [Clostridia bacterium]|nr:SpoIID/LytB domain-containing protein [Clostridia bacterium]
MKKFFRWFMLFALTATVALSAGSTFAAEYADTLRVGIYYDSATVDSLTFNSDTGFAAGVVAKREFVPMISVSGSSVTVEKASAGGSKKFYVSYSVCDDAEMVESELLKIRNLGIDVFAGYIDSEFHILSGTFENNNDALWEAENAAVKGRVISVSAKGTCLKNSSGKTLLVVDDGECGLAVYSKNFEDKNALLNISGSAKGSYRGGFESKILSDGKLTVVNVVPVEEYLYSVVCREMSPSWEVEALKAQAVCARNFALRRINYHSKFGFDVCRTVCCQAYSTSADNSESVHTAVDETRGELLFYNDEVVQTVYSSSMGKRTENVKNVWGSNFPYLVSVENPYEDTENIYNGKWSKSLTKVRATEIMKAGGFDIGDVTDISVIERTEADSVLKLQVTGTKGSKVFERERCRTIFSEATYSQRYTVSNGGTKTYPSVTVTNGDNISVVGTNKISVLGGNGNISTVANDCTAFNGKSKKQYKAETTDGDPDTFVFTGEGWGHGVGMSQYGAKGMAAAGFGYDEILTHYYTGTHLEKAY